VIILECLGIRVTNQIKEIIVKLIHSLHNSEYRKTYSFVFSTIVNMIQSSYHLITSLTLVHNYVNILQNSKYKYEKN